MHSNDFNAIVEAQIEACTSTLVKKASEYAEDNDRLHNFKVAAALEPGGTYRGALAGMMRKHTVSIYDMCYDQNEFIQAVWDEKITDHINYLLLLKAVVVEEMYDDETVVDIPKVFTEHMNALNEAVHRTSEFRFGDTSV